MSVNGSDVCVSCTLDKGQYMIWDIRQKMTQPAFQADFLKTVQGACSCCQAVSGSLHTRAVHRPSRDDGLWRWRKFSTLTCAFLGHVCAVCCVTPFPSVCREPMIHME